VKTMLKLGAERQELKVVDDQRGTPTYAIDFARCILWIIANGRKDYGLYHYSNEGETTWYGFAKAIFALARIKITLLPIRTSEYPTRAVRPAYSVMDKTKIKRTFNITIPEWRDSLITCINKLQ
jgi:dTDP-4-dehydrorhamnose reductase